MMLNISQTIQKRYFYRDLIVWMQTNNLALISSVSTNMTHEIFNAYKTCEEIFSCDTTIFFERKKKFFFQENETGTHLNIRTIISESHCINEHANQFGIVEKAMNLLACGNNTLNFLLTVALAEKCLLIEDFDFVLRLLKSQRQEILLWQESYAQNFHDDAVYLYLDSLITENDFLEHCELINTLKELFE